MKKLCLALLLCLFVSLPLTKGEAYNLETKVVTNETATRADSLVALTTIIPGKCRILGLRITPYGASCVDPYVELHDVAAVASMTSSTMFDALEADTNPLRSESSFYPVPKSISAGLCVRLGGYTAVVIFYERSIP